MPTQSSVLEAVGAQAALGKAVFEFFGEMPNVRMAEHEMLKEVDLNARMKKSRRADEED
jgi:hypothetical protein